MKDKVDCKYAQTGIVEVKTKKQYEIIKKVLAESNKRIDKTSLRLKEGQGKFKKSLWATKDKDK